MEFLDEFDKELFLEQFLNTEYNCNRIKYLAKFNGLGNLVSYQI